MPARRPVIKSTLVERRIGWLPQGMSNHNTFDNNFHISVAGSTYDYLTQRHFTKKITEFRDRSCRERLSILNLDTLEYRRLS